MAIAIPAVGDPVTASWADVVATGMQTGTAYTPTLTAATTNPTMGNSTLSGAYIRIGYLVFAEFYLTIGSTFAVGSGYYKISIPFTAATPGNTGVGTAEVFNVSNKAATAFLLDSNNLVFLHTTTDALIGSAGPGAAWATGNLIWGSVVYRAV